MNRTQKPPAPLVIILATLIHLTMLSVPCGAQTNGPSTSISIFSPTNGQSFEAGDDIILGVGITGVGIQSVQYFSNSNSLCLLTSFPNGSPFPGTNGPTEFPLTNDWTNAAPGNYSLTAVATDANGNMATSGPVNISVITNAANNPLSISLTFLTNGETLAQGCYTVAFHASDSESTVQTVELFDGTNIVAISSPPSSPLWPTNVGLGTHTLTAAAIDEAGNMATSAPVTITVVPMTISIAYLYDGESFGAPASIFLSIAYCGMNPVQTVQFFAGTNVVATANNYPGTLWSNAPPGSYTLTAVATDTAGNAATSAPVNITVTNVPFAIEFTSPTNGQGFTAPANIWLVTSFSGLSQAQTLQTVEFFEGANVVAIGTDATTLWSNVAPGSYTLTAVATDSAGNVATSAPVNITVTDLPLVISFSPDNGSVLASGNILLTAYVYNNPAAVEAMEFLAGSNAIATATNPFYGSLPSGQTYSYFLINWTNVAAGGYSLTAVAIGVAGTMATSAPVNVTVTNAPTGISITFPANGQSFPGHTTLSPIASVTGQVQTVEFFAGTYLLGTADSQSAAGGFFSLPTGYCFPPGDYSLTAVAVDAAGNIVTSAPVNITFANPAAFSLASPTNGQIFETPVDLPVSVSISDCLQSLALFAGTNEIGEFHGSLSGPMDFVLSNLTCLTPGNYLLTAVSESFHYDDMATSAPVNIIVTNSQLAVGLVSPTNGEAFEAPANISVQAAVFDSAPLMSVQYFVGTTSIGIATNPPSFPLIWSNVGVGTFTLTGVATDVEGKTATSAPVTLSAISSQVSIYAPIPVAIPGTNIPPVPPFTNVPGSAFLVCRYFWGTPPDDLQVFYSIGGTASNGVDYTAISNMVTIPSGQFYAPIKINALANPLATNASLTVVLTLIPSFYYTNGWPSSAEVAIIQQLPSVEQPTLQLLDNKTVEFVAPGIEGLPYAVQASSNLVDWSSICTNFGVGDTVHFFDSAGAVLPSLFYRVVPITMPANYTP
jgi:hypothetical protein